MQEHISRVQALQRDIQAGQLARATLAPTLHNFFATKPSKKRPKAGQKQPPPGQQQQPPPGSVEVVEI